MKNQSIADSSAAVGNPGAEPVADGTHDITKTVALEQMMTEATGRIPFQQVYLWTTSEDNHKKKATTLKYDVAKDGPAHGVPSKLPGAEELTLDAKTKAYLEVGIIIGGQPDKYKPIGLSRNKRREDERKMRGLLRRDDGAMRVFIPVSDHIQPQARFYVGCKERQGRLSPRVIAARTIFFYPEFWAEVDERKPAKQRMVALTTACKHHAAVIKTTAEQARVAVVSDGVKGLVGRDTPLSAEHATQVATGDGDSRRME